MYRLTYYVELIVSEAYEVRVIRSLEISETVPKFDKAIHILVSDLVKNRAEIIFRDILDFDLTSKNIQCFLARVDVIGS